VPNRPTRIVPIVLLAALVACGGGRTITAKDLAKIMPSAADAPAGTNLQADRAGPKRLDEFVDDAAVRSKLLSFGFHVAYTTTFASPGFPADASAARPGATLDAAFGVLLRDAKAAHAGFAFYDARTRARAKHLTPVLTNGLGEESFAYHFSSLDNTPLPGIAFFWRVGNALFSVVGIGNPGPDPVAVRALVHTIDARAER
jgi:hypothetical protein